MSDNIQDPSSVPALRFGTLPPPGPNIGRPEFNRTTEAKPYESERDFCQAVCGSRMGSGETLKRLAASTNIDLEAIRARYK